MTTRSYIPSNSHLKEPLPFISKRRYLTINLKRSCNTSSPTPRRLIKISTGDGKWQGRWNCDYLFSLQELHLQDLAEDQLQKHVPVSINISVQKHAGFGFSVDGRINTSFTRKCSHCSSPYCKEINTHFNVWVLPSKRNKRSDCLPDNGEDDPSLILFQQVIYIKPGNEAHLDSLIQDQIRLNAFIKDTCSELCEKSPVTVQCSGGPNVTNSIDKRWSKLWELKNV